MMSTLFQWVELSSSKRFSKKKSEEKRKRDYQRSNIRIYGRIDLNAKQTDVA